MTDRSVAIMQEYFGFNDFKTGQKDIIEKILAGNDVVGIMPTGSGKSICFQVPAMMFSGTTIVVSPLISLMKDQVDTLSQNAVSAAFINSSLTDEAFFEVSRKARRGDYKLIYLAPERLELDSFRNLIANIEVSFLAVDEAHCISQWGHNFRPSYLKVAEMIKLLPKRPPVAAFTATATPQVISDITQQLSLKEPYILVTGFDRENLFFEVKEPQNKFTTLLKILGEEKNGSSIVYCSTRKTVESVCRKLKDAGIGATRYHAGLDDDERMKNQDDFLYERASVIVATNAFGMGIDKSNIRLVVHYNMPKTMEHYYQEAGRAGRDGEKAKCVLFYSASDIITNRFLINNDGDNKNKDNEYQKLQQIIDYCYINSCLRKYILQYFGEVITKETCNNCGNCLGSIEKTDITLDSQKILSCIYRTRERFGANMIIDVLRGSKNAKIMEFSLDKVSTYGIMHESSKPFIRDVISFLVAEGYIRVSGNEFPILTLTPKAYHCLKSDSHEIIFMKKMVEKKEEKKKKAGGGEPLNEFAENLFEKLRLLRLSIARQERVPPFVVFSDAALKDMCRILPLDAESFLAVSGVGKNKLSRYGKRFIALIDEYVKSAE